jgi:hypothetical protein
LYEFIRQGPLKQPGGKYLLLGEPKPFAEPFCGIDGSWEHNDWLSYTQGETVRGHFSRYFGCFPGRAAETRNVLAKALLDAATDLGAENGLITHQVRSAQLASGQRTFLHDLGLIAELNVEAARDLQSMVSNSSLWMSSEPLESVKALELQIRWLLLPADHSSSLRVALVGSSMSNLRKHLGLHEEGSETEAGHSAGIQGALSWQPTFLLDDEMWFPYVQEIQNRRLYRPLGSWSVSMTVAAADARKSIDRKFQIVQAERHARKRQQAGNRQKSREVEKRRTVLLNVAQELWSQVVMEEPRRPGRPGHRKRLAELLTAQGMVFTHRDLRWLMQMLAPPTDSP